MDVLKLKIFDVLAEKIIVSEFENWLYNSEEIISKIGKNDFIYELFTINYKEKNHLKHLRFLAKKEYNEDAFLIYIIEKNCSDIAEAKRHTEIYSIFYNLMSYYDLEFSIIPSEFHSLWSQYDLIKLGYWRKQDYYLELVKLAQETKNNLQNCKNFEEKKKGLIHGFKSQNTQKKTAVIIKKEEKKTLTNKFLAFFKKI